MGTPKSAGTSQRWLDTAGRCLHRLKVMIQPESPTAALKSMKTEQIKLCCTKLLTMLSAAQNWSTKQRTPKALAMKERRLKSPSSSLVIPHGAAEIVDRARLCLRLSMNLDSLCRGILKQVRAIRREKLVPQATHFVSLFHVRPMIATPMCVL